MKAVEERTLQAFRRMKGWLAAHPELATGSAEADAPLVQHSTALGVVVQQITKRAAEQEAAGRASKGATAEARMLRVELIKHHMQPVADMAKASIPDVVRMTETLRMPQGKLATEKLFATAEAMAKSGEQFSSTLVARGLPKEFAQQLRTVAGDYKRAVDSRGQQVANRRGAAAGIEEAIAEGRKLVLSLSVIINRRLRSDSAALAEWNQLKRVTLRGARPASVAVPAPAPAPVSVPSPTARAADTAVTIPAAPSAPPANPVTVVTASAPARTPAVPATEAPAKAA